MDISHLSDKGVEEVFTMTDCPVMASHSDVRDIRNVPRNLKKEQIQELIRRKGLIGINFFAPFVGEDPGITDILRHMDYILELGGEDVLAIGSDFDGCDGLFPKGIRDVRDISGLRESIVREGFGDKLAEKIFFENARRFVLENVK